MLAGGFSMSDKQCLHVPEPPAQLRDAASRVADSATFSHSPRLRDFFSFVVKCSIEGRSHEINEYSIGVQVFGKHPDYNPSLDNIVRVTARQLRSKLAEYYSHEGSLDPWRIEIPKGAYQPSIVTNLPAEPVRELQPPAAQRWSTRLVVALSLLCVAGWTIAAWQQFRGRHDLPEPAFLLATVLADRTLSTTFVLDDPVLGKAWWSISGEMGIDGFVNRRYLDSKYYSAGLSVLLPLLERHDFMDTTSLQTTQRLAGVARSHGVESIIMSCRTLKPGQLKKGNFILIGGVSSNPWVNELQRNLAFEHVFDRTSGRRLFVNRSPKPGEPAVFETASENPEERYYTRVAMLKNPYGPGNIVLLGGTSRDATEAAGQFALSQTGVDQVRQLCGVSVEKLAGFELILETKSLAGADLIHHVVASRCTEQ
jgi:hypothetical protein